jgi:diadenosine tetraphosphate (Ap4A) HIT family hydrolase
MLSKLLLTFSFLMALYPSSSLANPSCRGIFANRDQTGCPFCESIAAHVRKLKPTNIDRTILASSKNGLFFAIPQRGGFLPGSLLITSKLHRLNRIADMSREEFGEFIDFYESIKQTLFSSLGPVDFVAFENGTIGSNTTAEANFSDIQGSCKPSGGGCLSHFHWHISPLQRSASEIEMTKSKAEFLLPSEAKETGGWSAFFDLVNKDSKRIYTLIDFGGGLHLVDRTIHQRRSEWMRLQVAMFLAEQGLMTGHYSWRIEARSDVATETVSLFDTIK